MSDQPELLSIGDLAEAAGISTDTIRVWERRYGRPEPVRLPSGHRRYRPEQVRWLRRVAEALARGHRPSAVVPLAEADLDALLAPAEKPAPPRWQQRLLGLLAAYEGERIRQALEEELSRLGPRDLVIRRVAPLLGAVGRLWADGALMVRHEHFLSEILEDFLREVRSSLAEAPDGPVVLLATLSGEEHGLGIQMAAVIAAVAGARPRVLGTNTPNEEIEDAVRESGARAVGVGVSLATAGVRTDRVLADLRARLPEDVRLIVGGRGARGVRRGPRGIVWVKRLADFEEVLREEPAAGGAR